MILEPRFTDDLADLPTHKFGPSSLTWWGIIAFMVIEGDDPPPSEAARSELVRREVVSRPMFSPGRSSRSSSSSAKSQIR